MFRLKSKQGFTLTELLTVIGIFVFLATIVVVNFRIGERNSQFLLATEQVASDLRKMQTLALTGTVEGEVIASGGFGAYFDGSSADEYLLFRDDGDLSYGASDAILETIALPETITLGSFTANPLTVIFKPPKPTVYINGAQAINAVEIQLESSRIEDKYGSVNLNRITGRITAELNSL